MGSQDVKPFLSLKAKLGFGAGLIGLVAIAASALTIYGMARMSDRIEASLQAEERIRGYSVLASQISTFMVAAAEASQSGVSSESSQIRFDRLISDIGNTFALIRRDLEPVVEAAQGQGLNEQSRSATRSIGIARMEAQFNATARAFKGDESLSDPIRMRGFIDSFSLRFDPLISAAISEEVRIRKQAIDGVETLRAWLTKAALGIGAAAALLLAGFYLGIVRPQLLRLDLLRHASQKIGQEDFDVSLPEQSRDEIGQLFHETNKMAAALAGRKADVDRQWDNLNQIVEERTEALQSANAALAQVDQDRRRFFADLSHELRTPLTVILTESELGMAGGGGPGAGFETIHRRAQRLNRRIDDLLRIARSDSGQITVQSEPFDLNAALHAAAEDMRAEIDRAKMVLTVETTDTAMVTGDRNWTRQIITGLIENSLRHARDGGRITLMSEQVDGPPCARVIDNGPGVPAAQTKQVFDRFCQASDKTKAAGFGIGLALAKWVMTEQGGGISLTSPVPDRLRLGKAPGTMVTVCFEKGA